MREEGFVSLWIAKVDDAKQLNDVLNLEDYNDDGDRIASEFEKCFDIEHIDSDFVESEVVGSKKRLSELLSGFSYDNVITSRFEQGIAQIPDIEISDFNAVILLYNFRYDGEKIEVLLNKNVFRFVGYVMYE